jgi:hypothetical protein
MRKFGMFFRAISGNFGGSAESGYPVWRAGIPKIGQALIIYPMLRTPGRHDRRSRTPNQTVSKRSITSVSARPARVHSWNAGNDIIASK